MSKQSPFTFDLDDLSNGMRSESDRACAILGAATLDAMLEDLLRRGLSCQHDALLGKMGPLGTFSSRIAITRALEWISAAAYQDLEIIRRVRNQFAHATDLGLSFSTQSVADRCQTLRIAEAFVRGFDAAIADPGPRFSPAVFRAMQKKFEGPRWRFELSVQFLGQYLEDLPASVGPYTGEDVEEAVRALTANTRPSISMAGTVGS